MSQLVEVITTIGVPIITAVGGWFGSQWRTRQKKDKDILDNVTQILEIQRNYISEQQGMIAENAALNKRLEAKLDQKSKSIRKANGCEYTNKGEGCPVLKCEDAFDSANCDDCKFKTPAQ